MLITLHFINTLPESSRNLYNSRDMFRRILRKKQTSRRHVEKVKSTYVAVTGTLGRTPQSPEDSYGDLLKDVQVTQVLGDGKQFVDMVPKGKK